MKKFIVFLCILLISPMSVWAYSSEVILSKDDLIQKMLSNYSTFTINFEEENPIQILEYTDSRKSKENKNWKHRNYRN